MRDGSNRLEVKEPTYILPSIGRLELTAYAHVVIEGFRGSLRINSNDAPVTILGCEANIGAILGESAFIEGNSGILNLVLDPHLSLLLEEVSGAVNGRHLNGGLYRDAPEREEGTVVVRGQSGNLTLRYNGENGLYLPTQDNQ